MSICPGHLIVWSMLHIGIIFFRHGSSKHFLSKSFFFSPLVIHEPPKSWRIRFPADFVVVSHRFLRRDFSGSKPPTSELRCCCFGSCSLLFHASKKPRLGASWSCSTAPAEICSLWSLLHVRWSKVAWPKEIFFCLGTEGAGIVGTDTEYCMDLVINLKKSSDWFLPGKFFALQTCTEVDLMSCCPALGMAKRWPRNSMCPSLVRASQHRKSKWIQNWLKLGAKMLWKPGGKKEKRRKQWIPGDSLWPFWDG